MRKITDTDGRPKEYIVELNRGVGDSIRKSQRYFERRGVEADVLPHKTALSLVKPSYMDFREFKDIVSGGIQANIGSVLMFSKSTGNAFICSNRGNRPGEFIRV